MATRCRRGAARAEGGGGGGGGAGGVGHGGQALHRPRAHRPDGARGLRGAGAADGVVAGGGDRACGAGRDGAVPHTGGRRGQRALAGSAARGFLGCACWGARAARECVGAACGSVGAGLGGPGVEYGCAGAALGVAVARGLLRAARRSAAARRAAARWLAGARGCLLPFRRAGVRRRACGVAAAAGRGGADGLGGRRGLPRRHMARRRRCRGRCSPSPPSSVPRRRGATGGGWAASCACSRCSRRPSCWWRARCRSGSACVGDARMQAALAGINAAVVGLLLAALYQPVLDQRDPPPAGFRARPRGAGRADVVEMAALAGGGRVRGGGRGALGA